MITSLQLLQLAEEERVPVLDIDLEGEPALSVPRKKKYAIGIDTKTIQSEAELKVCLAHEMGHGETGSFYNKDNYLDLYDKHERRANVWAYKKLVTEDELYEAVSQGYTEIWELAEYFNIPQDYMEQIVYYYEGIE